MKKFLCVILSLVTVFSLVACSKNVQPENSEASTTTETTTESTTEDLTAKKLAMARGKEEGLFYSPLVAVPDYYFKPTGTGNDTEKLTYKYNGITKSCIVYIPPGYDEKKQYNVYYLLGGAMASEEAFFNGAGEGSTLQNMFDHMIENGEVEPFIAVNVNFFYHHDHNEDLDNGKVVETVDTFCDELRTTIVPEVESKYSTFAESTDEIDLIASRKHRCFGGFSLGSSVSLLTLTRNLDYFYYYAPLCGADFRTYYPDYFDTSVADDLAVELEKLDYTTDDYYIFATEGENDNTFADMNPVMTDLLDNHSDLFIRTDSDKSAGNISYKVLPGWEAQHRYLHAYRYFYNSLIAFWGSELREDYTTEVTLVKD